MKERNRWAGIFLVVWGVMNLFRYLSHPRVQILHGTDIVKLIGAGACLVIGILLLVDRPRLGKE